MAMYLGSSLDLLKVAQTCPTSTSERDHSLFISHITCLYRLKIVKLCNEYLKGNPTIIEALT